MMIIIIFFSIHNLPTYLPETARNYLFVSSDMAEIELKTDRNYFAF